MTVPKYDRTYNETADGADGFYYCEVQDQTITRQIIETDSGLYWSTLYDGNSDLYDFTDQPEFPNDDVPRLRKEFGLIELNAAEFEHLWKKAKTD